MRSVKATLAAAEREIRTSSRDWTALCLMFTRTCLGIPARHPSAIAAWEATPKANRHTTPPPAGVPVFWSGGRWGHVAVSAGGGKCISTDIKRRGKADLVPIALIGQRWGMRYLGWADVLNGVAVDHAAPKPAKKAAPSSWRAYEVKPGDTLSALADRCGSTVDKIAKRNKLADPDRLAAGQVIEVPR